MLHLARLYNAEFIINKKNMYTYTLMTNASFSYDIRLS